MTLDPVLSPQPGLPDKPSVDVAQQLAAAFLLSCRSEHTRRAYARDLRAFYQWCAEHGLDPLAVRRVHLDGCR